MKSIFIEKTLGLLALSTLTLAATGALADWDRGGYGNSRSAPAIEPAPTCHPAQRVAVPVFPPQAYMQSQAFSQQIDARQDRQMDRIRAGMQDGRLSRSEFRELMHEQREIRAMEQYFLADGFLDAREFQRLDQALDRAGHNIRAEKHDREGRYAYNSKPWFN